MDDQPRQERKRKIFSLNNKLFSIFIGLVIAGLLCAGVYVFAIGGPPGSQWDPGETLNPGCTPGSGNCSTVPPAVYSFGSNNFTGTGTFTGGYESSFGNSAANRFQISTVTLGGGYGTYPLLRFDSSDQPLYSAVGNIGFISDYLIVYHENTAPSLGFSSPDLAVVSTFSLNETTGELNYSPLLGGTSPGINIAGGILAKGVIGDIRKLTFEHHDNSGFWGVTFTGNYIKSVLDDPTPLSMDTTFHFGGYTAGASADWLTLTGTTANFQGLNLTTTGTINTGRIYFTAANWSTALGYQALQANTTGNQNTAVGHQALWSNTTGQENTAVGMQALRANTIGRFNTAIGPYTLINNIDGDHNTAVGVTALYSNTSGDYNVAVGNNALNDNTTASFNTAMGYSALNSNTTGSHNTATGYRALFSNTTGADNTAIGRTALNDNNTGSNNTAISFSAL